MIMNLVKSSNIEAIGHDGNGTMRILFTNSNIYEYSGITKTFFDAFMASESKGKFFHAHKSELKNYCKI